MRKLLYLITFTNKKEREGRGGREGGRDGRMGEGREALNGDFHSRNRLSA